MKSSKIKYPQNKLGVVLMVLIEYNDVDTETGIVSTLWGGAQ